jgi:hypothetical protein
MTGELKKIAKILGRSEAFFFLPTPAQPLSLASFRPPAGRQEDLPLNDKELLAVRNVTRWQRIAEWIQTRQGNVSSGATAGVGRSEPNSRRSASYKMAVLESG